MIGEVGISKDEYFRLTQAETAAMVRGYVHNNDRRSADLRALFTLQYNMNVTEGHRKTPQQLWPLSIDEKQDNLTVDEMFARNKRIIEQFNKN